MTRRLTRALAARALSTTLLALGGHAWAATAGTVGCPQFHCTPEATGVMVQPIVTPTAPAQVRGGLGGLAGQGCSGDGLRLACLVSTSDNSGTLKLLDATTLNPLWTDTTAPGSLALGAGVSIGQVPFLFADGRIGAGDRQNHILYGADGAVQKRPDGSNKLIALGGTGLAGNMGLTVIGPGLGVVALSSGKLTLIDTDLWLPVGSPLQLRDAAGHDVSLASPPSGTDGVLYAPGTYRSGGVVAGFLFAVSVQNGQLVQRARYEYTGATGASPVVVKPGVTGLPAQNNLVLLHVPAAGGLGPRLMGLVDTGGNSFTPTGAWPGGAIALEDDLVVTPTLDEVAGTVYFQYTGRSGNNKVYAHSLFDGTPRPNSPFNVQARAGQLLPRNFVLNSHLGAIQAAGTFTLLMAGSSRGTGGNQAGQFMVGFQPLSGAIWARQIDTQGARGTAAWNLSPTNSGNPNLRCPVLVATEGSIGDYLARVCD